MGFNSNSNPRTIHTHLPLRWICRLARTASVSISRLSAQCDTFVDLVWVMKQRLSTYYSLRLWHYIKYQAPICTAQSLFLQTASRVSSATPFSRALINHRGKMPRLSLILNEEFKRFQKYALANGVLECNWTKMSSGCCTGRLNSFWMGFSHIKAIVIHSLPSWMSNSKPMLCSENETSTWRNSS